MAGSQLRHFTVYAAILIKLGLAPFHWWFVSVAPTLGWLNFLTICTVQKVLPLVFLARFYLDSAVVVCGVARVAIGLAGRVNTLALKGLLAYSSVFNGA